MDIDSFPLPPYALEKAIRHGAAIERHLGSKLGEDEAKTLAKLLSKVAGR